MPDRLSRRNFLRLAALGSGATLLAACAPAAPTAAPTTAPAAPTSAPAAPAAAPTKAAATSAPAAAGQAVLKLGHTLAPGHPFDQGMKKTADTVATQTSGAVKIDVYPSSQLGSEADMVLGLTTGSIDMMLASPGGAALLVPDVAVMEAPYLFQEDAHWQKVVASPLAAGWNDRMVKDKGVRIVGWFFKGVRHVGTRTKPLNTIDDIKGLKIRVADLPLYSEVFKALGASPTPIAFADMYMALSNGTVDGADASSTDFLAQKLTEVCKYYNLIAWSYAGPGLVLIREKAYQALGTDRQKVLTAAVKDGTDLIFQQMKANITDDITKIKAAGVQTITPTDLPVWREKVVGQAVPALAKSWGGDAKLYDTIAAMK